MAGEDRDLVLWVLSSLMVAEERITTKFSGLVGAYGTEEGVSFLATQQVDEARHITLRELLPAVAASLAPRPRRRHDWEALGASGDEIRTFSLTGPDSRLKLIAVDLG